MIKISVLQQLSLTVAYAYIYGYKKFFGDDDWETEKAKLDMVKSGMTFFSAGMINVQAKPLTGCCVRKNNIYTKQLDVLIMFSFNRYIRITSNGKIHFHSSQEEGQDAAANEEWD